MKSDTFEIWTHKGTRYVGVPADRGAVHVMDEHGNNFGAYLTFQTFRQRHAKDRFQPFGKAKLKIEIVSG